MIYIYIIRQRRAAINYRTRAISTGTRDVGYTVPNARIHGGEGRTFLGIIIIQHARARIVSALFTPHVCSAFGVVRAPFYLFWIFVAVLPTRRRKINEITRSDTARRARKIALFVYGPACKRPVDDVPLIRSQLRNGRTGVSGPAGVVHRVRSATAQPSPFRVTKHRSVYIRRVYTERGEISNDSRHRSDRI